MKQKVTVVVVPAPQGWPRVYSTSQEAHNDGAMYVVWADHKDCYLQNWTDGMTANNGTAFHVGWWTDVASKPVFDFVGNTIGFADFDSAARWWLDPKPISGDHAPVPLSSLNVGDYFLDKGILYVKGIGSFYPLNDVDGGERLIGNSTFVTPFHGTVTITVSPE